MDDIKAKQQIVEKIKESTNILITVSNDPSVDALSAAIGLTLLLDKLEKHPTAVFSGTTPPALAFLEPEKVLDDTTDSLRDFIIALDKEKADHLRYKVEGDSVKIFITPYKTTISSDDLVFSQGNYNVELVIALGVDVQEHLDSALESHGQILHDATVITMTAGDQVSNLGGIDLHDDQASSLSEMVAGLAEAMKTDKTKSLLDQQISTALLTGIVAETDRFSNTHTTSKVMSMAAQLMAGGADQQLIASKLEESHEIGDSAPHETPPEDSSHTFAKESLSISHKNGETLEEMDKRVKAAGHEEAREAADSALDHTANATAAGVYAVDHDSGNDTPPVEPAEESADPSRAEGITDVKGNDNATSSEPAMGGTLNATSEQAADDARRDEAHDQNKTTLSHAYMSPEASTPSPMSSVQSPGSSYVLHGDEPAEPTLGDAPAAPDPAPQPAPTDLGLPMPPPVPDFSAPSPNTAYAPPADAPQPERLGDILAPEAPQPTQPSVGPMPPQDVPPAPPSNDPGQFKIPGQQ